MERSEIKPYIAKRVAKELHDGDVVNLGIGLPTMVPDYLDPSVKLTLQSENGFIGLAAVDPEDPDAAYIVNAGGQPAGIEKGAPKILKECTLPLTAEAQVNLIVTEMGVMEVTPEGIVLKEYNPEFTVEEIQAATEAKLIIADDLKPIE